MATKTNTHTSADTLEELLRCFLCRSKLVSQNRPKSLPCLHTFCAPCLTQKQELFMKKYNEINQRSCPLCHAPFDADDNEGIKLDVITEKLLGIQLFQQSEQEQHYCGMCTDERVISTRWCQDCGTFLCNACLLHHGRYKPDDTVIDVTGGGVDTVKASGFILPTKCTEHQKEFTMYCTKCEICLCAVCASEHRQYDYPEIGPFGQRLINPRRRTVNARHINVGTAWADIFKNTSTVNARPNVFNTSTLNARPNVFKNPPTVNARPTHKIFNFKPDYNSQFPLSQPIPQFHTDYKMCHPVLIKDIAPNVKLEGQNLLQQTRVFIEEEKNQIKRIELDVKNSKKQSLKECGEIYEQVDETCRRLKERAFELIEKVEKTTASRIDEFNKTISRRQDNITNIEILNKNFQQVLRKFDDTDVLSNFARLVSKYNELENYDAIDNLQGVNVEYDRWYLDVHEMSQNQPLGYCQDNAYQFQYTVPNSLQSPRTPVPTYNYLKIPGSRSYKKIW